MDQYIPIESTRDIQRRIGYLFFAAVALLALLLFRVWYLQAIRGAYYKELSENNRIRVISIQPHRGFIYDRAGRLLANYAPSFNLYAVPEDIPDKKALIERLTRLIDLSPAEVEERLILQKSNIPYLPIKLRGDLSLKEVAVIEAHRLDLPGIRIEAEPRRNYLYGTLAAHLLGYVGEIATEQLLETEKAGIPPGTIIGQYGIEQSYDPYLRGTSGKKIIEVDALGQEVKLLDQVESEPGHDLYLTIDLDLQRVAEEALEKESGAIVAMNPKNGEVLAIVSHPAFDPNQLTKGLTASEWQAISEDPGRPITNRAIQGQYPPGSVFKLVVTAAGVETGMVKNDFEVVCRGFLSFGGRVFQDWKKDGHGLVNLEKSIVQSCDVFFYQLGRMLEVGPMARYASIFGLGQPTGIELTSEKSGLIPTVEWKKKFRGEPWYPGENLLTAIGQGYLTVTPLQMANLIGTVAVSGARYQPHVVKAFRKNDTGQFFEFPPVRLGNMELNPQTFEILRRALLRVVSDPQGTGRGAFSRSVSIGGKTGTAQVISSRRMGASGNTPKEFQDHAWFVAFAPVEDPEIAVAVLVENGGQGGKVAAPLARRIIEEYFSNDRATSDLKL